MTRQGDMSIGQNQESHSANTGDAGIQTALVECWPGGPIATSAKECHEIDHRSNLGNMGFPMLELTQVADNNSYQDPGFMPLDGNPPLLPTNSWTHPELDS